MNADPPKAAVGSTTSALLAQAALYGQLAWVELNVEKDRLLQMLVILLVGFSLLTSLLVAATTWLLLASWDTPYRTVVLLAAGAVHCAVFGIIWWRFMTLARKGHAAFCDTREELATDFALLRSRLEQ